MPPCVQTCASPAEKSTQEGDGITKTKRSVFTSTKQAHYIQTMPHQPQSPSSSLSPAHAPGGSQTFLHVQRLSVNPKCAWNTAAKKKKKAGAGQESEGGSCGDTGCLDFIYLLAFILIRWNNTPLFWGGICKCFRAIKREMKVSMDSMREY